MAEIKPFGALRFTPEAGPIDQLVCPPYDIISEEERAAYLARNPNNIIRLELPREGEEPYAEAGETLRRWLADGTLDCDDADSLYIYEEEFTVGDATKSIKGLVCRVRLEEFSAGVVLPHEETLSKAKEDRFRLMCATGCNFSSIYSLYFDREEKIYSHIRRLSEGTPLLEFRAEDGILHRVWRVTGAGDIALLCGGFGDEKLYIADGHHRYETALRYREHLKSQGLLTGEDHAGNYIMMTLLHMEHPGLVVLPTHRIVHSLTGFHPDALLAGCRKYFSVTQCPGDVESIEAILKKEYQSGEKAMVFYQAGSAYLLELEKKDVMRELLPDASVAYRQLDVSILHTLVLEKLLDIDRENLANQKNLTYTRSAAEACALVNAGEADCAFLLSPTKVEEIAAVAGAGEKMPQKSTYFYPKLITGHVMNQIL